MSAPLIVLIDDARRFVDDRRCIVCRISADVMLGRREIADAGTVIRLALDDLGFPHKPLYLLRGIRGAYSRSRSRSPHRLHPAGMIARIERRLLGRGAKPPPPPATVPWMESLPLPPPTAEKP